MGKLLIILICSNLFAGIWYPEAKRIALDLYQNYSPEDSHFIFVGSSPTPVATILEIIDPTMVSYLPFSRGRDQGPPEKYSKTNLQKMNDHLQRFLPWNEINQNKTIYIFDYVSTGEGLINLSLHLEYFFNENKINVSFIPLGLISSNSEESKKAKIQNAGVELVEMKELDFFMALWRHQFRPVSKYRGHQVKYHDAIYPEQLQKRHQFFFESMKQRMLHDDDFQEILKERISEKKRCLFWFFRSFKEPALR